MFLVKSNYTFLVLFFLFSPFFLFSQSDNLDHLVNNLKSIKFDGIISAKRGSKLIQIPREYRCGQANHDYLWYKEKLVLKVDGSGQLYEVNPENPLLLKKMDTTCFEGYSFGAFNFVYRDTIFSIGGYGFWQYNGMLRYFDGKAAEWFIVPTKTIVPIWLGDFSKPFYDIINNKIYFIYQIPKPDYEESGIEVDKTIYVQCLDLASKRWWEESKIFNIKILDQLNKIYDPAPFHLKNGMLVWHDNIVSIFNFEKNILQTIEHNKSQAIDNYLSRQASYFFYAKGNALFFYNQKTTEIDSVIIYDNDLIDTNIPLYWSKNIANDFSYSPIYIFLAAILIFILSILFWLIFKNILLRKRIKFLLTKKIGNIKKADQELSEITDFSFIENLTEVEKGLLDLLIKNSLNDLITSVTQSNHVLGITGKPLKIQNNIRAACIQSINKKFTLFSGIVDDLIEKQRTDFDKRFFEYKIQKKYLKKIHKI